MSKHRSCAYGDESIAGDRHYLMTATVVDFSIEEALRDVVRSLHLKGQQRLHWHGEDAPRRLKLAEVVGSFPVTHYVVVARDINLRRQERERRRVLGRLLWELDQIGASDVVLESRRSVQDRRDDRAIGGLRNARRLSENLVVRHVRPSHEMLLALPDITCGAVGQSLLGRREMPMSLAESIRLVDLDD